MEDKNIKLIEGTFEPNEALRILTGVINSKISYHNLDSFSNQIRFENAISGSKKRINELEESLDDVKGIIEFALNNDIKLKISSDIKIEFV